MKKIVFTVLVGLLISVSAMAQSKLELMVNNRANKALEKVEATVKLSEDEKVKYLEMQKAKLLNHFKYVTELKDSDPDKFKEKARENNRELVQNILKTFGKSRGREILDASRKK